MCSGDCACGGEGLKGYVTGRHGGAHGVSVVGENRHMRHGARVAKVGGVGRCPGGVVISGLHASVQ